jgi:hypothetical protein
MDMIPNGGSQPWSVRIKNIIIPFDNPLAPVNLGTLMLQIEHLKQGD